jgi:multiple sugar transport system substrate-binding protein
MGPLAGRVHLLRLLSFLLLLGAAANAAAAPTKVKVWRHETDPLELEAGLAAIARFNHSQDRWLLDVETLPQDTYTSAVTAAALAGQLPCMMTLDQPVVPNFAWSGHIRPVEDLLAPSTLASLNEGGKGVYRGHVYSVGQFDAVLALFAKRSDLKRFGVRVATMQSPYTAEEFRTILRAIKAQAPQLMPFDLNSKASGEWLAYAFGPWIQSAGGDIIDRRSFKTADGFINGDPARTVARWYQSLFAERLAEQRVVDDQGLIQGRTVFHYSGSWEVVRYSQQFGDDLVIMPPPDFGRGPKVGAGSWHWAVSKGCRFPNAAAEFLEFLLSPREIAAISDVRALVPTTDAGAAISANYREGSPFRIMYDFARLYAVKRPETPGYPKISSAFEKALQDIKYGKNVDDALDGAADAIDSDIRRNRGYGFQP